MKLLREIVNPEYWRSNVYYHGSPSGDLRGGTSGLHLGTHEAATQALEARIGKPAEGSWDGTREYGKTRLMGKINQNKTKFSSTGHNSDAPDHDYYPHEHKNPEHKYANGESMPNSVKPNIKGYNLIGPMSNNPHTPHEDFKANGYMQASLKKGNAKRGYFYKNVGEDEGSISAVVPNGSHVKPNE
jgi:hypothetical protein